MAVRTRGGRFMVDVRHRWPDGRVERIRLAVPDEKQSRRKAEAFERSVLADLRAGVDPRRGEVSTESAQIEGPEIRDYVEQHLREQCSGRGLKASTLKSKRGIFKTWIVPLLGTRRVDAIRTSDFTALRVAMSEAGRSPKTINNALLVLSSLVRWWHEQNDRPAPSFRVNPVKVDQRPAAFYGFEEYETLVEHARRMSPEHHAIVLLGGDAGLRMSEVRALHRSDIDHRAIVVQRTREDDDETAPKGRRSRVVPMTPRLAEALGRMPRNLRDPHVFLDRWGEPLTRKEMRVRMNQAQRAAGLPGSGYHILRHTFCSHLAMRGAPAGSIRELAGHVDLQTTQRYMHLSPSALDDAIALLGGHKTGTPGGAGTRKAL